MCRFRFFVSVLLLICCGWVMAEPHGWTSINLLARSADEPVRVQLSDSDWQWLREKRTLRLGVSEPDYAPFDITGSGTDLEGITADIVGIIADSLNVRIEVRRYSDRDAAVAALSRGEIDLLSRATGYEAARPGVVLSVPYFSNQPVVIGPESTRLENSGQLVGKRIAVVSDYYPTDDRDRYLAGATVQSYRSVRRALEAVAFGQADLFVGDAFSAQYLISQGYLANLKLLNFASFNGQGFSFALDASDHRLLEIEVASDGSLALQQWHPGDFDLVITDCNMPVLNGYGLARRIRELEEEMEAEPCVIFGFTANAQPDEIENCRRAGMDDCLFKPIGLDNLRARLDAVPKMSAAHDDQAAVEKRVDGFDLKSLREMTGGNPGLIRRLLEELHSSNRIDIDQVRPLWEAGDWKQLADLAHRMKGAARLVNADTLQDLCSKLEGGCKDGLDSRELGNRALAVEQAMATLQDDLLQQLRKLAA